MLNRMLNLFSLLTPPGHYFLILAICFGLFLLLYLFVYRQTSKLYFKMVKR